jgi:hypothetical protein
MEIEGESAYVALHFGIDGSHARGWVRHTQFFKLVVHRLVALEGSVRKSILACG